MKKNEKLLYSIGEVNESLVPEIELQEELQSKPSAIKRTVIGGGLCAAALIGVVAFNTINDDNFVPTYHYESPNSAIINSEALNDVMENHRIYPEINIDPASQELSEIPSQTAFDAVSFGFEGYMAYDISELYNSNPWMETMNVSSLPVFRNLSYTDLGGMAVYLTEEQMSTMAENVAYSLDITIESTQCEYVSDIYGEELSNEIADSVYAFSAICNGENLGTNEVEIRIFGNGEISISFNEGVDLPNEYSFTYSNTDSESALKTMNYLVGKFQNLLQFENPIINTWADRDIYGDENRTYEVFNRSDNDIENILNYNLCKAEFCPDDNGNLMIIRLCNSLYASECIGNYPTITLETAKSLLLDGNYITSVPADYLNGGTISEDAIKMTELVYRCGSNEEYYQPYYRFYVELSDAWYENRLDGMKDYGAFYVPAVSGEYLTDFTVWNGSFN